MSQYVFSISSLVSYLKKSLDSDINLSSILLKGELSNCVKHRSGHYYFTLKDANARINCVMFATYTRGINFDFKEGVKVIASGRVSVYEASGSLQFYAEKLQLDGLGDLYLELEKVKHKLASEGLFDENHKKALPVYPASIGLITAKEGAAFHDVESTIKRRWPLTQLSFYPTLVQGKEADKQIIEALLAADQNNHDCLLLVRGGGSIEDLWCFNSEALARCVYACKSVIISGVGHESDTTLVDYVADYRAPTPTGAAEIATPNSVEVLEHIHDIESRMSNRIVKKMNDAISLFQFYAKHRYLKDPTSYLENRKIQLDRDSSRLMSQLSMFELMRVNLRHHQIRLQKSSHHLIEMGGLECSQNDDSIRESMKHYLDYKQKQFSQQISLLDAYSPLKILNRGYSITYHNQHVCKDVDEICVNDQLTSVLANGEVLSIVVAKEKKQ